MRIVTVSRHQVRHEKEEGIVLYFGENMWLFEMLKKLKDRLARSVPAGFPT